MLSKVHLRLRRLSFGGWIRGSKSGFGCESKTLRWAAVRSLKTVRTYGMWRSEWRVWFETYHGAFVMDLRSLDWYRWMMAMLDFEANSHSYMTAVTVLQFETSMTLVYRFDH